MQIPQIALHDPEYRVKMWEWCVKCAHDTDMTRQEFLAWMMRETRGKVNPAMVIEAYDETY